MKDNTAVCTKKRKPDEEKDEEPYPSLTNKKERVWIKSYTLFREIIVEEYEEFFVTDPKFGYKTKRKKIINTESSVEEYKLKEVSAEELYEVRTYGVPLFILKENNRYFYAWIPFELRLLGAMPVEHKCAPRNDVCKRLTPSPDKHGGCAKVRARNPRIESYAWITHGYESVNTICDCFMVLECEHQVLESQSENLKTQQTAISSPIPNTQKLHNFGFDTELNDSIYRDTDPFLDEVWKRLPKRFY